MYKLAICDDQKICLDRIANFVKKNTTDFFEVYEFISASKLIEAHNQGPFDVVLLDINMPEMDGFEACMKVKNRNTDTILCFITGEDQFVKRGYQYNIFRFVSKADLEIDLQEALVAIIEKIQKDNQIVFVRTKGKVVKVKTTQICYIESKLNYVDIHLIDEVLTMRGTLTNFTKELNNVNFLQISKSMYVNFLHIKEVDFHRNEITLQSKEERLYISRTFKQRFRESYVYLEVM